MSDHKSTALEMTPLIERVHGENHPELTRVRELTEQIAASDDTTVTADAFRELRTVTNNYALPEDACEAYTAAYEALSAWDAEVTNR